MFQKTKILRRRHSLDPYSNKLNECPSYEKPYIGYILLKGSRKLVRIRECLSVLSEAKIFNTYDIINSQRLGDTNGTYALHDINQLFNFQTFRTVVDGYKCTAASVTVPMANKNKEM